MSGRRISRPSPALAVALVALFVALGGVSYAAISIPDNSVGSAQLKDDAVVSTKLGSGAVTAGAIRDDAVGNKELADKAVTGAKIASDAVGSSDIAAKAVGTSELASKAVTASKLNLDIVSIQAFSPVIPSGEAGGYQKVRANCPKNYRVLSGGAGWVGPTTTDNRKSGLISGSRPYPPSAQSKDQTAWEVYGTDTTTGERRLMAVAVCLRVK